MWMPGTADQLESAVNTGALHEGLHLDAKAQLPAKNDELAKDVAAMTVDGGVLIIGVGEHKGRLATLHPFELGGLAERVDQIVQTSIVSPPQIEVRSLLKDTGNRGYLAIVVPPSPLAPHQVTVGGDLRFYGRGATGNKRLTEGEVARLYERRRQWQQDREALLNGELELAPFPPDKALAYLYGVARPVASVVPLLEATAGENEQAFLQTTLDTFRTQAGANSYSPTLREAFQWYRRGASGWSTSNSPTAEAEGKPRHVAHFEVDADGTTHLFNGRAADTIGGAFLLFRDGILESVTDFLRLSSLLWEPAGYLGPVDVGVAMTGLYGAKPWELQYAVNAPRFTEDSFRTTGRVDANALSADPEAVALTLLRRFLDATGSPRITHR